jgi:hypothetical protein
VQLIFNFVLQYDSRKFQWNQVGSEWQLQVQNDGVPWLAKTYE